MAKIKTEQLKNYIVNVLGLWFPNKEVIDKVDDSDGKLIYDNDEIIGEYNISGEEDNNITLLPDGLYAEDADITDEDISDDLEKIDILALYDAEILSRLDSDALDIITQITGLYNSKYSDLMDELNSCQEELAGLKQLIQEIVNAYNNITIDPDIKVSEESGNMLVLKDDGLYIDSQSIKEALEEAEQSNAED